MSLCLTRRFGAFPRDSSVAIFFCACLLWHCLRGGLVGGGCFYFCIFRIADRRTGLELEIEVVEEL